MKKRRLPWLAVFCGALALVPLASLEAGHWLQDEVFGEDVSLLSPVEMAASKGGVGMTVIRPRPSQRHYIDNPRLIADVFNYQNQGQTRLYLHHGTSKTGTRVVPTAAPGYAGRLESRFKHLGGTEDLVIKYLDTANGALKVARTVPAQKMDRSVRLHRIIVHNVQTTLNQTNVGGSVIARAVDSQSANRNLAVSDSIDRILSQCPRGRRTQFQLTGEDDGAPVHTISTHTSHCANLEEHVTHSSGLPQFDAVGQACMQELFLGALATDHGHDSLHVYIVKDLHAMHGFSTPLLDSGVVIRESEFNEAPWWQASLLLHEIGHSAGLPHRLITDPECRTGGPHERALMCPGTSSGKKLSVGECDAFYEDLAWLEDHS